MKWPNKKYKIGENHLCRSVFFVTQISQMRPVRSLQIKKKKKKSPTDFTDLHRYLLGRFFSHADFADDADFFSWDFVFIGFYGIYSEVDCWDDYSRIFADATCPVVADTPWDWTKRFTRDSIKNLCKSVKSVGQNNPHEEKSASSAKSAWQKQQEHI